MLERSLRVLVVEGSPDAAGLATLALQRGGIVAAWERVATAAGLRAALAGRWDAVLAGDARPDLTPAAGLALVRAADPDLPFVAVVDAGDADAAFELLRAGANDFVFTHTLDRLAPVVEREVRAAAARRARRARPADAVGEVAGGVAHDFNNLLTVITNCSDMLLQALPPDDPAVELAARIHWAGEVSVDLNQQFLDLSHAHTRPARVFDLNAVVAESVRGLRSLAGPGVEVVAALAPDLWPVRSVPGAIRRVLINLTTNARDAMPDGGRMVVETRNVELDAAHARAHPSARPGPHVLLSVSDTGRGMSAAVLARIFELHFTTKGSGVGNGLGLAIVAGIVQQSAGHVGVTSEPGFGTTFRVYLPRADAAA